MESNDNSDKLVQLASHKTDRKGHKGDSTVGAMELQTIAVDDTKNDRF